MITVKTSISCTYCNRTVEETETMDYRITGAPNRLITRLKNSGWVFYRDEKERLNASLCEDCKDKEYLVSEKSDS